MGFWIFIPAGATTGLFVFPLSPIDGETDVPVNRDVEFGLYCSGGFTLDLFSIQVSIDGYAAVVDGYAQPGWSMKLEDGFFPDSGGDVARVVTISHDDPFNDFSTVPVEVIAKDITCTCDETRDWTFVTSDATTHNVYYQFGGTPSGRYTFVRTPTDGSQLLGTLDGQDNESAHAVLAGQVFGILDPQTSYRLDQVTSLPSNMPVFLGPRFAGQANSRQRGAIKLQPIIDGYQITELVFALVNSTLSFSDFEDAIDVANADASGTFPLPIAYWSMDNSDTLSTTILDSVGSSHGTASGTPSSATGQVQQARSFNGTTDYYTAANETLFDFDLTDAFSVAFWFNTTSTNEGLITKQDFNVNPGWQVFLRPGGELILNIANSTVTAGRRTSTTAAFNDGSWHNAIVTYDGSDAASGIIWYIDGVSVPTTIVQDTAPGSIINNDSLQLGQILDTGAASRFYTGDMDEVAIWDQELTASQAFEVYSRGATNQKLVS